MTADHHHLVRETFESPTGASLNLYTAAPDHGEPRGIVQVLHGLSEHAGRYDRFAGDLTRQGFHMVAHDHRGHGHTTAPDAPFGRFAARHGRRAVIEDVEAVRREAVRRYPDLPVVLFGHSMGALIALNHAETHGDTLAGLAIWNCDANPGPTERWAHTFLGVDRWLRGSDVASPTMERATFKAWAKAIANRTSDQDWLTGDPHTKESYERDPLTGFSPTISMWRDVVGFVLQGGSVDGVKRLPKDLPIHLLGGTEDPCSENGRALQRLAARMERRGVKDVTCDLIEGARHETLQEREPQREAGLDRLRAFLDRILPAAA